MSQTLHGFALTLLTDPAAMAEYRLDPDAMLAQAGLDDITPQDVQEIMPLVMDYTSDGNLMVDPTGGAGSAGMTSPLGDFVANGGLQLTGDGAPSGEAALESPFGALTGTVSMAGAELTGTTGDFSAVGDLGDSLDAGALSGVTGGIAEGITQGGDYLGDSLISGAETAGGLLTSGAGAMTTKLTGGANTASDLLTSGASSTASLLSAGSEIAAHALNDPAGAVKHVLADLSDGKLPVDEPRLPFDQLPPAELPKLDELPLETSELPVGVPSNGGLPLDLPVDLSHLPVDVSRLPAGELPELPQLPQLPGLPGLSGLSGGDPLGSTVQGVNDTLTSTVQSTPAGDMLGDSGLNDMVSHSPVADVLGGAGQPAAATDVVSQVPGLDDLPL